MFVLLRRLLLRRDVYLTVTIENPNIDILQDPSSVFLLPSLRSSLRCCTRLGQACTRSIKAIKLGFALYPKVAPQ